MVIVQRSRKRGPRERVVDDGEAPACLVPVDLPTDAQPPEIEALLFACADGQCIRHVLLMASRNRRTSPKSLTRARSAEAGRSSDEIQVVPGTECWAASAKVVAGTARSQIKFSESRRRYPGRTAP